MNSETTQSVSVLPSKLTMLIFWKYVRKSCFLMRSERSWMKPCNWVMSDSELIGEIIVFLVSKSKKIKLDFHMNIFFFCGAETMIIDNIYYISIYYIKLSSLNCTIVKNFVQECVYFSCISLIIPKYDLQNHFLLPFLCPFSRCMRHPRRDNPEVYQNARMKDADYHEFYTTHDTYEDDCRRQS